MSPQRRRRTDSRAVVGAERDDPFRFMSSVIDWRRVATMLLVSIPTACAVYYAGGKVLEQRAEDAARRLDVQRDIFLREFEKVRAEQRDGDARALAIIQRELDGIRQDVREIRAQQGKR